MLALQMRSIVPATPDPTAGGGATYEALYYIGSAIAAFILGWLGYLRGRPEHTRSTTTVAGAIIDNAAIAPLIDRLDKLIAILTRDVALRERDAEDEAQQERVDRAVHAALERLMRDPPADMPPARR